MRYPSRLSVALPVFVLLSAVACGGDLEHSSPFDPQTPLDKQARAEVRGRFTLEGERDHAGIEVRLEGASKTDVSTRADGTFAVNQIIPGTYTLVIGERGWQEVTRTVDVAIGAQLAVPAEELPLRKGALSGKLTAADGADVDFKGASVRVRRVASLRSESAVTAPASYAPLFETTGLGYARSVVIDENNDFFIGDLETGDWIVEAQELLPGTDGCSEGHDPFLAAACRKVHDEAATRALNPAVPLAPAPSQRITITGEGGTVDAPPLAIPLLSGDLKVRGFLTGGLESQAYTATRSIKLRLTAANAFKMVLGQGGADGDCLFGDVENFAVAPALELAAGDGVKTVCVLLVNEDATQSVVLRGAIVLDTTAPGLSVVRVNGGQPFSTVATIPLELVAYDAVAGLARITRLRNGADLGAIDYVPAFSDTLVTDATYAYTLRVADRAGNLSAPVTSSVTLDRVAPAGLAVGINGGAAKTSERLLQLALATGGAEQIQVGLDNAFGGIAWQPATTATQLYVSRADGTITVFLRGRDGAGNVSEVASDSITLDTTPPDAVAVALADIDGDGYPLTHARAELTWSATVDPNAVSYELQRYVIGVSSSFDPVTTVAVGTETFADDITATAGRVHQYRVRVRDSLGQASQWSNVLAVNTMAADGQVCWAVNQATGADIAYTLVPPTGAIASQVTSSFLDMTAGDNPVVTTYPGNALGWSETRRALDVAQAGFTINSTNLDSVYRQQGHVDAPMGWHWDVVDRTAVIFMDMKVLVDAAGNVHVVYIDASGNQLRYAVRKNGVWATPVVVVPSTGAVYLGARVDAAGKLDVVYANVGAGKLQYVTNRSGAWSAPVDLATGTLGSHLALRADRQGNLHAAFTDGGTLRYLRQTGGAWGAPTSVTTAGAVNDRTFGLDLDAQGAAHISYQGSDKYFRYVNNVGGSWNAFENPEGMGLFAYGAEKSELRIDAAGKVHILEYNGDPFGSAAKKHWTNASGAWQVVYIESGWDSLGNVVPATFDAAGSLHVIDANNANHLIYRTRSAGGAWSADTVVNSSQAIGQFFDVTTDEHRDVLVVYAANKELRFATTAGSARNALQSMGSSNAHLAPLVLDSRGVAHTVSADFQKLWYQHNAAGVWSSRAEIAGTSEFPVQAALAVDASDHLHVAYPSYSSQSLRYMYWNGVTWSAPVSLDPAIGFSPEPPSIQAGPDGKLHVAYYDDVSDDLRYVQGTPGSWSAPVTLDASGDTGHFINLAVDRQGGVHVAYFDKTSGNVKYVKRSGAVWAAPVVVAPGTGDYTRNPISLGVDSQGFAHITYFGLLDTGVKYVNNRKGTFSTPVVLDAIRSGAGGSSLAIDSQDRIHVATFTVAVVKYVLYTGRRWLAPVVVASGLDDFYGDTGGYPTLAVDKHDRAHLAVFDGSTFSFKYKYLGNEIGCSTFSDLKPISPF
jgi:hypothetical protein